MRIPTTLIIIEDGDKVLLAMKKRGFGAGWWNGFGGKVQEGETIEEAAIRELEEESGLAAKEMRQRGKIDFFEVYSKHHIEMHIFEVTKYKGEPVETEEMRPKWFLKSEIPYDEMWPNDEEWQKLFFAGHDFEGTEVFDEKTKTVVESKFKILKRT